MNTLKFQVIEKVKETNESFSFLLKPLGGVFPEHTPGKYLPIKIRTEKGLLFRSYSLSSSAAADEDFKITVKREKGGRGSNWLCDNVNVGDLVETLPPAGNFYPQNWGRDFIFFAGGSGITPVISIIKTALNKYDNNIKLFYANSSKRSVIFHEELKKLSFDYPERLDVEFWLDDEKGIPTSTAFEKYVDSDSEAEYFICGPAPFMEGVGRFLMDSKVPLDLITKESFAGGVSDENIEKNESKEKDVTVSVVLNGVRTDVMCSEGSYILKEIISAGVNVPNSCGAGNCGSCMCSLLSGDVVLEKNTVLDSSDEEDGWILACRSKPKSKYIEISFDH